MMGLSSARVWLLVTALSASSRAFAPSASTRRGGVVLEAVTDGDVSSSATTTMNVVVVSPPGGVGEVAAVEAARRGASVRWFVVSTDESTTTTAYLSEETVSAVADAGGAVELAGAEASSLLVAEDDADSAVPAARSWCGRSDAVIACADLSAGGDPEEDEDVRAAVRVATRAAAASCDGLRVAVTAVEELDVEVDSGDGEGEGLDVGQLLPSFLGGNKAKLPPTLKSALSGGRGSVLSVRHGDLFGVPESSRDVSPFIGGPRREPKLREEYTTRAVRLDSSEAVLSNANLRSRTRSSRLSVGAAAAILATKVHTTASSSSLDVCLASLRGEDAPSDKVWTDEFKRVEETLSSSSTAAAELFSTSFGSVPDVDRLAEWLATKWAPAVLRTYDLAGIRVGARPVYAVRVPGETRVEILWQELENFESRTVGKIVIDVDDASLSARRDASGRRSLKGEDIVVRSLVDAAAQAVEKGLAVKPAPVKKPKPVAAVAVSAPPATSVVSSITVEKDPVATAAPASSSSGPRAAGRRRSSERSRGKRRKKRSDSSDGDDEN